MTAGATAGFDDSYLDPGRLNFDAFKALPRDEPIDMLNVLQFRAWVLSPAIPMPRRFWKW